jgi:hypothetical protein
MSFSEQIEQTMQDHLHKLTNTTNSIKTLSLWAIHHAKKNADIIVNTWLKVQF